jgi:hypothetical protein
MDYIPVPNCAQLEFVYSFGGQTCENVLHYTKDDAWDVVTLTALADAAIAEWIANIKPVMTNLLSLTSVIATDLASQSGPSITRAGGLPSAGTQTGTALPNNCALVVTKRTTLRGRSFRGRIYHPGLPTPQTSANNVTGAFVTNIVNGWNALTAITMPGPITAQMVVVSKFTEGNPRVLGITTPVVNVTSDGVIDSQRRRLPGRGK